MLTSNLKASTLSVFLLVSTLVGCTLPEPKDKATLRLANVQKNATFTAQAMADRSKALETIVDGDFRLPSSKVFNLQACLKDVAYDRIIVGHDFRVETATGPIKTTSDKLGCITWSEQIQYNYLANSQYIRIERDIHGLGLHKGIQSVAFAINPWSHGETLAPVLNPDDGNTIPHLITENKAAQFALQGMTSEDDKIHRKLWADDGRFFVTEQKMTTEGVSLLVELRPNLSIQMTKMNGEIFLRQLTSGRFKARLKIIHMYQSNNQETRRLLAQTEELQIKMENASLAIKGPLLLPAIPTRGQIFIGLELEAINGPVGLDKFEGLYLVGDYDQLKVASFLKLNTIVTEIKDFKLSEFINAEITSIQHNPITGSVDNETYQKPKIEVAPLEFRFVRVGDETTSTRQVIYNIRACVRSGLDQKLTRAHKFRVTKFRQSADEAPRQIEVTTDNNSCINWDESLTFKYFECQRYLKGSVEIESTNLGMKERLEMIVNPWEAQGSLARDMRYVDLSEKIVLNCSREERPRTQMLMDNFHYNTLSYDYSIDRYMNLHMFKKIEFRMEPRMLIYSSLANGRGDIERLRDGIYLLRTAIVQNKDYDTLNTYVTSADALVNIMNGQVNTVLTYQVNDLKALGNRNTMLVDLRPVKESLIEFKDGVLKAKDPAMKLEDLVDKDSGLETPTFTGPIMLNMDDATRPLRILDAQGVSQFFIDGKGANNSSNQNVISQVVDSGKQVRNEIFRGLHGKAQKQTVATNNNLNIVNLSELGQKNLADKLTQGTQVAEHLRVTKADLANLITSETVSPAIAQKLCAFWSNDLFRDLYKEKGGAVFQRTSMTLGMPCFSTVRENPAAFFQVERQLLVKDVVGSRMVKGFNQGLTVGHNFSLSASHSKSYTESFSLSVKGGLSKKFLDLVSIAADAGYSMSWSTSDATSTSNSVSVAANTSMMIQHNIFTVRVKKYEQCVTVKLNPAIFIKKSGLFSGRDYTAIFNPRLSAEEKVDVMTRGLMICEGEDRTEEKDITENYYLVAQETGSSQMQDNGDVRNRNFFIALRSKMDFDKFVLAMKGTSMPLTAQKDTDDQTQATQMVEKIFQLGSPATPGVFRVDK